MSKKWLVVCLMVALCLLSARGVARGEEPEAGETTIWVPGPVTPGETSGYTIQPPGGLPSTVRPVWGGAYEVQRIGELPITVTTSWGGGYKIQPPGELPTHGCHTSH